LKFNSFPVLDLKNVLKDEFNNRIEFYREEVELRIESLKIELDLLKDEFGKKFDLAKKEVER
jgi:ABC-type phosphate transport system auxiliary subunit